MASIGGVVDLQVFLQEVQGLRLFRGGEMRLVITLRASDDPTGLDLGAKVTPWVPLPDGAALQWIARAATFQVPAERCFEAEFVDSAHLHVDLEQRGHAQHVPQSQILVPSQRHGPSVSAAASACVAGFEFPGMWGAAALRLQQQASTVLTTTTTLAQQLGSVAGLADRAEVVGSVVIPVGKRLIRAQVVPSAGDATWVELGSGEPRVGSLLMELRTHLRLGSPTGPPVPLTPSASEGSPGGTPGTPEVGAFPSPGEAGRESSESEAETPDTASGPPRAAAEAAEALVARRRKDQEDWEAMARSWQEAERVQISARAVTEMLASSDVGRPPEWQPLGSARPAAAPEWQGLAAAGGPAPTGFSTRTVQQGVFPVRVPSVAQKTNG